MRVIHQWSKHRLIDLCNAVAKGEANARWRRQEYILQVDLDTGGSLGEAIMVKIIRPEFTRAAVKDGGTDIETNTSLHCAKIHI